MELRYLRYFLAVAEEMHFSRAAKRLHISQPPLTRQIQALERELGTRLLERDGKRFRLTEAGAQLRDGAARILDEVAALERQVRLVGDGSAALVRLGYVGSMMFSLLPELLSRLEKRLPEIKLDVIELPTEKQVGAILSGAIDLGLVRSWVEIEGVLFKPVGEESLSIAYPESMSPPGEGKSPLSRFAGLPLIAVSRDSAPGLRGRIDDLCAAEDFVPQMRYECGQLSSVLGLVAAGLGWTVVPAFSVRRIRFEGVRVEELGEKVVFGIAHRLGVVPERVRAVAAEMEAFIADITRDEGGRPR